MLTYKGVGNVGGCIEQRKPASQFSSTIKRGQIIDDQWEESRLGRAQEEAQSEEAPKVIGCCR
jgi:hypothetical protein